MSITLRKCKEKDGEIYNLVNTDRKVCVLPETKEKKNKAVLID